MSEKIVWKDYIKKQHTIVFAATILCGFAAHGYMFFNKLSWHDDMNAILDTGATYTSGRWFAGILGECVERYLGNVSVPWFNGLFSLLFLAAGNVFLVEIFHLKRNMSCILLGGMMAVFPSWVSTYGYMYKAVYYAIAILLAILGAYFVCMARKIWHGVLGGAICICLSLGIYQTYLPLTVTILLIAFLNNIIEMPESSLQEYIKKGIADLVMIASGIIFYLSINKMFLSLKHMVLTDYQNINQMGRTNIKMLINGIRTAWKEFMLPTQRGSMYMQSVGMVYYAVLILTIGFLGWHVMHCWRKNRVAVLFLLGTVLCFPIGMNLLYLMGDIPAIHGVMMLTKVMVFILPIVLVERMETDKWKPKKYGMLLMNILLVYVGIFYIHFANVCYLQAEFRQKEVISWMNALIARIQSEEGYRMDLPIAYLNSEGQRHMEPATTWTLMEIPGVEIGPYDNSFSAWKTGLVRWCGFQHDEITDISEIEMLPEVQEMTSYPDAGSVRIIDGVIIVKF